ERTDASDKKAAVNANVAEGLHENMAIACAFAGDYTKAHSNLDQSLKFAQQGMVNVNKVDRLKAFHGFIDDLEKGRASNGDANTASLVEAPDIKKLLGRRKFNEDIDFLIAQDKYAEFSGSMTSTSEQNAGEATLESALGAMLAGGGGSYESRVNNGMLILNSIFDRDLNGQPLPESICGMSGLTTLNARNMGLTGVPACIGQLTGLDKLYLDGNAITELPESLGQLTGLTLLDISDNQLTSLPEGVYQLKNLKKLTVSGNQLGPEVMSKLAERLPDCKIK
ncbi:MAG TPA: leucine-rich repeat domain-containing protein, partial [Flavobacteriales bacterium]|nr:leucine-rich repeat domain-containing protein [Flavobacteriales bacterium]